jgi:hypothetical protein
MRKLNVMVMMLIILSTALLGFLRQSYAAQPGDVEIQVNCTPEPEDDLVSYGGGIMCCARLTNNPTSSLSVVLTAINNRLSFDNGPSTIIPLDQTGAWTTFMIYGTNKSQSKNDVKIEAHKDTANGDILGDKEVTVYWLDGSMTVTAGGSYGVTNGAYGPVGGPIANFSATAILKPSGIDASKTKWATWEVGMLQNVEAYSGTVVWSDPKIEWTDYPYIPDGHEETAYKSYKTVSAGSAGNDTNGYVYPLYDKPNKPVTIDQNSLKPIGTSSATATSNDSPGIIAARSPIVWMGAYIADVYYDDVVSAKYDFDFRIWAVGYDDGLNSSDPPYYPPLHSIQKLDEKTWGVHVDSTDTNGSKSIVTGDGGVTFTPGTTQQRGSDSTTGEAVGTDVETFTYHKEN